MPNRRTHQMIGTVSSAAFGLAASEGLPDSARLTYCIAAAVGGWIGGELPDVLEPACHSHHRDFCHSVTASGGVVLAAVESARIVGENLRAEAAHLRALRLGLAPDDPRRLGLATREYLNYVLLGITLGGTVGYASHVLADMTTPRGVPLLSRRIG